jgi:Tfp pilus assembly protein PilF
LAEAQFDYERALAIEKAARGPEHPDTTTRLSNQGRLLQAQGDLVGARAAFERALRIFRSRLGAADHSARVVHARRNALAAEETC